MATGPLMQLVEKVTDALDREGVEYAITGSIASSIHGEPWTSMDVDLVVTMSPADAVRVAKRLSGPIYADAEMLRDAAARHSMANLFDPATGYKVDLSALAPTPYHAELMRRRVRMTHPAEHVSFWIVSPEDIILMKLVWRIDSRSTKQWSNALGVAKVQGNRLDWAYLHRWANELGVTDDLEHLKREAGIS